MSRRQAREFALQVLFHTDIGRADPESALSQAFSRELDPGVVREPLQEKDAQYAKALVRGTWAQREEIDHLISIYAHDWSVGRMAGVDRNILRLAIYEIMHVNDVPDGVAADEAVELAKLFSSAEASKFINGILGSVIRGIEADKGEATPVPPEA
ncbi:MAG: transcription antitermination factor NusB [Mycobacterium leprae]